MAAPERWQAAWDAWGLGPALAGARTPGGTINETTRIVAAGGDFFLRTYRQPGRAPGEHAIIAHAASRGVPAVAPVLLPDGRTWLDRDGARHALFPRAPGRQLARTELDTDALAAMGATLAALHRALRDYPPDAAPRRPLRFDRDATIAGIVRLEGLIRRRPGDDPLDPVALRRLATRRAWLSRQPALVTGDETVPGEQVIHGDYQEANLFFADGAVSAIIDWDNHYVASPAWEVARVLDLVCGFRAGACRAFLAGYRAAGALDDDALDRAVAAYGLMRAHDLWLYSEYYEAGNARVGQFIHPGDFTPLAERWAAIRPALAG